MNARELCLLSLLPVCPLVAQKPLPPVHDGAVLSGPGEFRYDGELLVKGRVTLRNMTLHLRGPIRVSAGATLDIEDVHLLVADPASAPNGTSGLRCEGPAHVIVRRSTMSPVNSAHPMWLLKGDLDVDSFATTNSEFHLDSVHARIDGLKIFELEISRDSQVSADGLDLVFLSTHSSENDHLRFENIPVDRAFSRTLDLGSGAHAQLKNTHIRFFLLYIHGQSSADLAHMGRVQLALSPDCEGTLHLPNGRLGSAAEPEIFPKPQTSNCPFHIGLNDVNVDTWDVYASGHTRLTLDHSKIDELIAGDHANITVLDSIVYADWLGVNGDANMRIENSTVGALSLSGQRPDLATSQIRITGRGRASFKRVRFDCGILAEDDGMVSIAQSLSQPKYIRTSGHAVIRTESPSGQ
ncbi:MAG TPA: hypothetical protein VGI45_10095 [Terracidiphilus sp.]|jgi:hypothetical protein